MPNEVDTWGLIMNRNMESPLLSPDRLWALNSLFSSQYCGLFSCLKLITYLNLALRLRVAVVLKIPVFGMTPCTVKLGFHVPSVYIWASDPIPPLYI
jgi:hypothetical protein